MKRMNSIMRIQTFKAIGAVMLAGFVWGSSPQQAAAGELTPLTLNLERQQTAESLVVRAIGVKPVSNAFKKEPSPVRPGFQRGLLQWGTAAEQPIPFIWQRQQGRLYLDLNRNQDLTDDPSGLFVCSTNGAYQVFTNVQLARVTPTGPHPVAVELWLIADRANNVSASAGLCSYWHAQATLSGQEYQFGIVEDALEGKSTISPAYLLLRPWAERDRPFNLRTSTPDFAEFSSNLFLANQPYSLDCRYDSQATPPQYRAILGQRSAPASEVQLTGSFIHRLILKEENGLIAVIDKPVGTFQLPQGKYSIDEIWMRDGDIEVARFKAGTLKVTAEKVSRLAAGGPLTNWVTARSSDYFLNLGYELRGADGGIYHFPRPNQQQPPEFAIFESTNRLATGKFNYG